MENCRQKTIGPYVLNNTLGKGQTGIVRLGIHCTTKEKVAVKIIDRTRLNPQILSKMTKYGQAIEYEDLSNQLVHHGEYQEHLFNQQAGRTLKNLKVEREIAIMKLIEHPHVLQLYDVYENKTHLFLILEYVGGGELFDYLVKKGRLSIKEARRFFTQIISAIDFCHKHCVCHRDLKPENLLLDEKQNIKVADFGMASLQVGDNSFLETSCGSPHYACPEVVKGIKYDGRKADIWSCGVILYALVVGVLPFDDDNLRHLLEKVKKGVFRVPDNVLPDCQHLIKEMIKVDPTKRITMKQILNHQFLKSHVEILEQLPVQKVVKTEVISSAEAIDPDVFSSMNHLGCFHNKERLVEKLLREEPNMEKVMYFLLLERKERRPSSADVVPKAIRHMSDIHAMDPPRKRVDSCGSPRLNRSLDSGNDMPPLVGRPRAGTDISSLKSIAAARKTNSLDKSKTPPGSPWWSKIPGMKKTGSSPKHSPVLPQRNKHYSSNPSLETSPNEVKRSWFAYLPLGHSHTHFSKDEPFFIVLKEKPLSTIKADIVHAFLTIPHLTHNVASSTSFTAEYGKHKASSMFRKSVRVDVNIENTSDNQDIENQMGAYTVNIKLVSGSSHKFKKLCEKIQQILLSNGRTASPEKARGSFDSVGGSLVDGDISAKLEERPYMSSEFHSLTDTESEADLLCTPENKNNREMKARTR